MPDQIAHEMAEPFFSLFNMVRLFMNFCVHQFFREVMVLGIPNIPKTGPVIFCGNHGNQMMDGCILFAKA
jgi:glycerol-3-phosphate O-acyltransferase/dihydroxyacetone phosphate acyltransferase